jgi:hypothetical protein
LTIQLPIDKESDMDKLRGLVASFTFEAELDLKEYSNGIVG